MTACSWWFIGIAAANAGSLVFNVRARLRWQRLNTQLEQAIKSVMDTYLPGAEVLKHLDDSDK